MILVRKMQQKFGKTNIFSLDHIEIRSGVNYIIGANGTGKTTFLKLIAGILKPTMGEIKYDGKSISESLNRIGIVFDEPYFFPYLTGLENLYYFNENAGLKVSKEEIRKIYSEWNIGGDNIKYRYYSLGMKKKLSIVFSLMRNPSYWILDEPFNGLDTDTQNSLNRKIREMKNSGKTIILSSHSINDNIYLADHIITLNKKRILYYPEAAKQLRKILEYSIYLRNPVMLPSQIQKLSDPENPLHLIVPATEKNFVVELLKNENIEIDDIYSSYVSVDALLSELEEGKNESRVQKII